MGNKVFLSYSYEDKQFADWLANKFVENQIDIWYDTNEIKVGESIKQRIEEGISTSSTIIVILSKSSIQSKWVKYELNSALLSNSIKQGIEIIIVSIDNEQIPSDLAGYTMFNFFNNPYLALSLLIKEINSHSIKSYPKLDWNKINSKAFEELVYELLLKEGYNEVIRTPATRDSGYDFIASSNKCEKIEKVIIEVKFYKKSKISTETLRRIYAISLLEKATKVILITNSELTNSSRSFLARLNGNIIIWNDQILLGKLYSNQELIEKYFSIHPLKTPKVVKLIDHKFTEVQSLVYKLETCPEGKEGWKKYENICIEILKDLFVPPLGEPKIQSRRESGIDIRDAVFPNRSNGENWKFIREDYDAKYIVFEFKNYSDDGSQVDKYTILQISDYLKKTLGKFGIICSRKIPNNSGIEKRKDIFNEHGKLIIFLSNSHLTEMLWRKYKGLDPSDIIIDLIDDFNLSF